MKFEKENEKYLILLIEDEVEILESMSCLLEKKGYRVHASNSGSKGIEFFEKNTVDVVLTDMKMPVMDGIDVIRALCSMNPLIPVIVLTGFGTIENTITALKMGAFNYLTKPCENQQILQTIRRALNARQDIQEDEALMQYASETCRFRVPSQTHHKGGIIQHITSVADKFGYSRSNWSLHLALEEALNNAKVHGNKDDPKKNISITAHIDSHKISISIEDSGTGMPREQIRAHLETMPSPDSPSGRGLFLINAYMDEVHFNEKGNRITLVKRKRVQD